MSHRGIAWAWAQKGVTQVQKHILLALGELQAASAMIAKIPFDLACHVAEVYHPCR